jgi:uncharacterized protein (DUF1810 family)
MDDPFDLRRFVEAQNAVYEEVCAELRAGRKETHWMWFIFPQIQGLGRSPTAVRFAISSRDEAVAYGAHKILGARLRECTALVNAVEGRSVSQIFGFPDDLKFHSSMTCSPKPRRTISPSAARCKNISPASRTPTPFRASNFGSSIVLLPPSPLVYGSADSKGVNLGNCGSADSNGLKVTCFHDVNQRPGSADSKGVKAGLFT